MDILILLPITSEALLTKGINKIGKAKFINPTSDKDEVVDKRWSHKYLKVGDKANF